MLFQKICKTDAFKLMAIIIFSMSVLCANAVEKSYRSDMKFLESDPYRKSKARVELSGIKNDFELNVTKDAINDILRLVRLFGLGNKLPNGQIIMTNTRLHPAFLMLTTEQGRQQLDIDPASTRHDEKYFNWNIKSDTELTVDVILKHQPLSLGPAEIPGERIYRLGFVKNQCDAKWCLNEAKRLE